MSGGAEHEAARKLQFRREFISHTRALFESFGAPVSRLVDVAFANLLRAMASFPNHSLGNQALIALQAPASRSLASAPRWQEFGRHLVVHPHAVYLWAAADDSQASEHIVEFSPLELREVPRTREFLRRFKMVPVYDVSETEGPELPEPAAIDCVAAIDNLVAHLGAANVETLEDSAKPLAQLRYLLAAAVDTIGAWRAQAQQREMLATESEAIKFVLSAHFGLGHAEPGLGVGLAADIAPHARAEAVKARLIFIHDIAREIIAAARPGCDNDLLAALIQQHTDRDADDFNPFAAAEPSGQM